MYQLSKYIATPIHKYVLYFLRVATRLVLILFYTTPEQSQLSGPESLNDAICKQQVHPGIISLGNEIGEAYVTEMPRILETIISPRATTRVHRSYAWIMLATPKVNTPNTLKGNA